MHAHSRALNSLQQGPFNVWCRQTQSQYTTVCIWLKKVFATIIAKINWYDSFSLRITVVMLPHLIYTMSFSLIAPCSQPLSCVTPLCHYILSIFCTAFLLICILLPLFTDVFCLYPCFHQHILFYSQQKSLHPSCESICFFQSIIPPSFSDPCFYLPIFSSSTLCLSCLILSASEWRDPQWHWLYFLASISS